MKNNSILFLAFALLPSLAVAQHITFENTEEYRSLDVYDTWEQSPFRTGVLVGSHYVKLTANPDKEEKEMRMKEEEALVLLFN